MRSKSYSFLEKCVKERAVSLGTSRTAALPSEPALPQSSAIRFASKSSGSAYSIICGLRGEIKLLVLLLNVKREEKTVGGKFFLMGSSLMEKCASGKKAVKVEADGSLTHLNAES
jgi:hypothetical protein